MQDFPEVFREFESFAPRNYFPVSFRLLSKLVLEDLFYLVSRDFYLFPGFLIYSNLILQLIFFSFLRIK